MRNTSLNKKGIAWDALAWIIIIIVSLLIMLLILVKVSGKSSSLIGNLKNMFGLGG